LNVLYSVIVPLHESVVKTEQFWGRLCYYW